MLCNYMSLHLQGQRLSKYFIRQFFILLKLNTRDNLPGEWGKDSEINKIVYTEPCLWAACRISATGCITPSAGTVNDTHSQHKSLSAATQVEPLLGVKCAHPTG